MSFNDISQFRIKVTNSSGKLSCDTCIIKNDVLVKRVFMPRLQERFEGIRHCFVRYQLANKSGITWLFAPRVHCSEGG